MADDPKQQHRATSRALNILCKWRKLLAGWQLGTRTDTDPVAAAVRDHREATLLMRAEMSALTELLIRKGLIAEGEWLRSLELEAIRLNEALARRFPGISASEQGLHMEFPAAAQTMKGWPQ